MTKYKYLSLPSQLGCIVPDVDVEPHFPPLLFLVPEGCTKLTKLSLGPVLLLGMGWFQMEGGLKITAKPVNDWTYGTMQSDMLPSESAGQRERMFSPVTSREWICET